MAAEQGRAQGVGELTAGEQGQRLIDDGGRHFAAVFPVDRQGARLRVEVGWQGEVAGENRRIFIDVEAEVEAGTEAEALALDDVLFGGSGETAVQAAFRRQAGRRVEREEPALVACFECRFVGDGRGDGFDAFGGHAAERRAPGLAVEIFHDRAAPIELVGGRLRAVETDAEGDCAVLHQLRDAARRHLVGKAGLARVRVLRQAPERTVDAREKQVKHEHQRQGLQEQAGRLLQVGSQRAGRAAMHADQGGHDQPQRRKQPGAGGQALRVEVMRQEQKKAEDDDDQRVAPALQFEQLHRHEHDEHGDPGIAPEQGMEFAENAGTAAEQQQEKRPAPGQTPVASPQPEAPEQDQAGQGAQPERLVQDVRCRGQCRDAE